MKKMLCVLGVLVMVGWLVPVVSNAGELLTDGELDSIYSGQGPPIIGVGNAMQDPDCIDVDDNDVIDVDLQDNDVTVGVKGGNAASKGGQIASKGGEIEELDAEKGGQIANKGGKIEETDRPLIVKDDSQRKLKADQNQNVTTDGNVGQALMTGEAARDAAIQVVQVLAGVDGMLGINVACASSNATATDTVSINQAVTQIAGSQCVVVAVGQVALPPMPE